MPEKPRLKYGGRLDAPMPLLSATLHPATHSPEDAIASRMDLFCERMMWLFEHYDISPTDPDHWYKLSACLAMDHVRAFQVQKQRGKIKWDFDEEYRLYAEVQAHRKLSKGKQRPQLRSIEQACAHLAGRGVFGDLTASELARRFRSNRQDIARIINDGIRRRKDGQPVYPVIELGLDSRRVVYRPNTAASADQIIANLTHKG